MTEVIESECISAASELRIGGLDEVMRPVRERVLEKVKAVEAKDRQRW